MFITIDLEDWFHQLDSPINDDFDQWDRLESRIETITYKLLSILQKSNVKAIFFTVGWIAKKYPSLIRAILDQGHEIGNHTYFHRRLATYTKDKLEADFELSHKAIFDAARIVPRYFRAPGFSITSHNVHVIYNMLCDMNYQADFSYFPGVHFYGGMSKREERPFKLAVSQSKSIDIYPMSTKTLLNGHLTIACGGGFFRLLPLTVFVKLFRDRDYCMFYLHPRDVDPEQPKVNHKTFSRRFRSNVGLTGAKTKLVALLEASELENACDIETKLPHDRRIKIAEL